MLVRLVGLLLLSIPLSGAAAGAAPGFSGYGDSGQAALQGLAEVDSLLDAEQPGRAAARIRDLLAVFGSDPIHGWQFEERLGVAMLRDGRPGPALPLLEVAVRRNPDFWLGHRNLGAALMALGRRGRALSEYRQAVDLAPGNFKVRLEYGQVLLEFGNYAEATLHLEAARELCPDCAGIRPALARLYLATGKLEPAIGMLQSLFAEDPSRDHRRTLVQALQAAGRDSLLLALWSTVPLAELDPDEILLLVETEGKLDRPEHSLEFARRLAAAKDPLAEFGETGRTLTEDAGFWGGICWNLLQTGHFKEALAAAERAVSLAPDQVVYRNNLVVALTKLGRHEQAAQEWNKVLALDPTLENQEIR